MRELVLTGLGNEMDFKTGRSVFTAVFNGHVRIEISEEAAKILTSGVYGSGSGGGEIKVASSDDYSRPPSYEEPQSEGEQFGGDIVTNDPIIEDTPSSVYEEDTGVEQV